MLGEIQQRSKRRVCVFLVMSCGARGRTRSAIADNQNPAGLSLISKGETSVNIFISKRPLPAAAA